MWASRSSRHRRGGTFIGYHIQLALSRLFFQIFSNLSSKKSRAFQRNFYRIPYQALFVKSFLSDFSAFSSKPYRNHSLTCLPLRRSINIPNPGHKVNTFFIFFTSFFKFLFCNNIYGVPLPPPTRYPFHSPAFSHFAHAPQNQRQTDAQNQSSKLHPPLPG